MAGVVFVIVVWVGVRIVDWEVLLIVFFFLPLFCQVPTVPSPFQIN